MKIGDRILTDDGMATIKEIEIYRGHIARIGLLYDKAPEKFKYLIDKNFFKDNILFHYPSEYKNMTLVPENEKRCKQ